VAMLDLIVDEHTSEVGIITRLEAFCDLLERKKSG
jgi:predicted nucleotide-binding protein (sugar kinase/HSP70/actin superfamily)